eukprot:1155539-Prymnesium_polylepis.1
MPSSGFEQVALSCAKASSDVKSTKSTSHTCGKVDHSRFEMGTPAGTSAENAMAAIIGNSIRLLLTITSCGQYMPSLISRVNTDSSALTRMTVAPHRADGVMMVKNR